MTANELYDFGAALPAEHELIDLGKVLGRFRVNSGVSSCWGVAGGVAGALLESVVGGGIRYRSLAALQVTDE